MTRLDTMGLFTGHNFPPRVTALLELEGTQDVTYLAQSFSLTDKKKDEKADIEEANLNRDHREKNG